MKKSINLTITAVLTSFIIAPMAVSGMVYTSEDKLLCRHQEINAKKIMNDYQDGMSEEELREEYRGDDNGNLIDGAILREIETDKDGKFRAGLLYEMHTRKECYMNGVDDMGIIQP